MNVACKKTWRNGVQNIISRIQNKIGAVTADIYKAIRVSDHDYFNNLTMDHIVCLKQMIDKVNPEKGACVDHGYGFRQATGTVVREE